MQTGPAVGLIAQVLLLAALAGDRRARRRRLDRRPRLRHHHGDGTGARRRASPGCVAGPASWVTLARATLAVGVAALVADSFARDTPVALLVALAAVALSLDLVDGWIARRTDTMTALGARFDGEVDAFLILALSVYVAPILGAWVLAIGAARYLFLARRVAAALDARAAPAAPLAQGRRGGAGRRAHGRGGRRPAPRGHGGDPARRARRARGVRRRVRVVAVAPPARAPAERRALHPASPWRSRSSRCCWCGPPWSRRTSRASSTSARSCGCPSSCSSSSCWRCCCPPARAACWPSSPGAVLALLMVVKVLDMGFITAFDRPFDPISDSTYVGIGVETLRDAIGRSSANLAVAAIVVLARRAPRRSRCSR